MADDSSTVPGWSELLPEHRSDGDDQPTGRPRLLDELALTDSLRLAVYADDRGRTYPVPVVMSTGGARRARPGDGAAEAVVALVADGSRTTSRFELSSFQHADSHPAGAVGERAITVDQTNESVVVGEHAVVKWTFLAEDGPHPGPSLLAELSANGFTGMPRPWGVVQWQPTDGSPARLVAQVVELLPGAFDGWDWVVDDLRQAVLSDQDARARCAGTAVGALVADFHRALAGTSRMSTAEETAALRESTLADLDRALAVTSGSSREVLAAAADTVRAALERMSGAPTPVMRVHGDLHIGQVLRARSTYALTDFDGNPVVPASSRSAVQPAAADVAGMAQSFTHAGLVVRRHNPDLDAGRVDRMARVARAAFLCAYRDGLGDRVALLDERLLRPFALRQVCREFTYAATHLPRWSYVPEAALPLLLEESR